MPRRIFLVLTALLLPTLPCTVRSGEERLYPLPHIDKICNDLKSTLEVMQCLAGYLEDAKAKLLRTNTLLLVSMEPTEDDREDPFKEYGEDIENYQEAHEIWERSVESMCEKFILRFWFPGSIYKTKTLECKYVMYVDRDTFIRNLFKYFFELNDPQMDIDK